MAIFLRCLCATRGLNIGVANAFPRLAGNPSLFSDDHAQMLRQRARPVTTHDVSTLCRKLNMCRWAIGSRRIDFRRVDCFAEAAAKMAIEASAARQSDADGSWAGPRISRYSGPKFDEANWGVTGEQRAAVRRWNGNALSKPYAIRAERGY
jgi:hypothetical protein